METKKRILINKSKGQLRVARLHGSLLFDLEIENADREQKVDRICNGEVISIEPSLEAAFVDFGAGRNGFLPLKEIAPEYYPETLREKKGRPSIKDILFEGQKILVQILKEERGSKGAALSTYISLAGCYLVLMPNNPKAGGISRRIEGDERDELKSIIDALNIPEDMGVIVRTAGMGKSLEELQWDLDVLVNLWNSIKEASKSHGAPYLIHQESDIAIRAVRDHLRPDISEILIDDKETYENVKAYVERVRPAFVNSIKFYQDSIPLFSRFQIEKQIESVFQRKVKLPAGGEIVIDRSEALTAIDVNSAQATKGKDIEMTALNTNLEAADEIARQLRIRDLGGLVVIDFIDMDLEENNHKVEDRLYQALKDDRARIQIAPISRFGLLEMSRQRLRSALNDVYQVVCPQCHGQGTMRSIKSQAISIIHLIEENALKENTAQIRVQVPVDVATYLINEQRHSIDDIETIYSMTVMIVPNQYMKIPQYQIECLTKSGEAAIGASYELVTPPNISYEPEKNVKGNISKQEPAVKDVLPPTPAPIVARKSKSEGLFSKLKKLFFGTKEKEEKKPYRKPYRGKKSGDKYFQKNSRQTQKQSYGRRTSRSGYRRSRRPYGKEQTGSFSQEKNNASPRRENKPYQPAEHPIQQRPITEPVVKKAPELPLVKPIQEIKFAEPQQPKEQPKTMKTQPVQPPKKEHKKTAQEEDLIMVETKKD